MKNIPSEIENILTLKLLQIGDDTDCTIPKYIRSQILPAISTFNELAKGEPQLGCIKPRGLYTLNLGHVSHVIKNIFIENDIAYVNIKILSTSEGIILKNLLENNIKFKAVPSISCMIADVGIHFNLTIKGIDLDTISREQTS